MPGHIKIDEFAFLHKKKKSSAFINKTITIRDDQIERLISVIIKRVKDDHIHNYSIERFLDTFFCHNGIVGVGAAFSSLSIIHNITPLGERFILYVPPQPCVYSFWDNEINYILNNENPENVEWILPQFPNIHPNVLDFIM